MDHSPGLPPPDLPGHERPASQRNSAVFRAIRVIDALSDRSGKLFAWLTVPMVGGLAYEVISRYLFHACQ